MNDNLSMEKYPHLVLMLGIGLIALLLWGPLFLHFLSPQAYAPTLIDLYAIRWATFFSSIEVTTVVLVLSIIIGLLISSIEYNVFAGPFRQGIVRGTATLMGLRAKWDASNRMLKDIRWDEGVEHFEKRFWLARYPSVRRDRDWNWFVSKAHAHLVFVFFMTPVLMLSTALLSNWLTEPVTIDEGGWVAIVLLLLLYLLMIPGHVQYRYMRALADLAIHNQFEAEFRDRSTAIEKPGAASRT